VMGFGSVLFLIFRVLDWVWGWLNYLCEVQLLQLVKLKKNLASLRIARILSECFSILKKSPINA